MDELEVIVQRMIDAGESEENIATVIQGYDSVKTQPPTPQDPKKAQADVSGESGLASADTTSLSDSGNNKIRLQERAIEQLVEQKVNEGVKDYQITPEEINQRAAELQILDQNTVKFDRSKLDIPTQDLQGMQTYADTQQPKAKKFESYEEMAKRDDFQYKQNSSNQEIDVTTSPIAYTDEQKQQLELSKPQTVSKIYGEDLDQYGINTEDFNGYIEGGNNRVKKLYEKGFYTDDTTDFFQSSSNEKLIRETSKHNTLSGYVTDRVSFLRGKYLGLINTGDFNKAKEVEKEMRNLGNGYQRYVEDKLPTYKKAIEDKLVKEYDEYKDQKTIKGIKKKRGVSDLQKELGDKTFGSFFKGIGRATSNLTATVLDFVGADDSAEYQRMIQETNDEFDNNSLEYGVVSGKKIEYKGKNLLVNNKGRIIDLDEKKDVTAIASRIGINSEEVIDKAKSSKEEITSYSPLGLVSKASEVIGDLAVQLATTRGAVNAAGTPTKLKALGTSMAVQSGMVASSVYEDTLSQLRKANIDDEKSKGEAAELALEMGIITVGTSFISPNLKGLGVTKQGIDKEFSKKLAKAYVEGGKKGFKNEFLKQAKDKGVDFVKEGGKETIEEFIQNISQKKLSEGVNEEVGKNVLDTSMDRAEIIETAILSQSAGLMALRANTPSDYKDRLSMLEYYSQDVQQSTDFINNFKEEGALSEVNADKLIKDINNYAKYSNKIPEDVPVEKVEPLLEALDKRNELELRKKNQDKAFHKEINEEIEKVDAEIANIRKPQETKQVEEKTPSEVEVEPQKVEVDTEVKQKEDVKKQPKTDEGTTEDVQEVDRDVTKVQDGDVATKGVEEKVSIQEQKKNLENKRTQEIKAVELAIAQANEAGTKPEVNGKPVSQKTIDEINEKYDSQLATLKTDEEYIQAYEKNKKIATKARIEAKGKPKKLVEKATDRIKKTFEATVDRQFTAKEGMRKMKAERVVDYMVAKAGASSSANFKVEKAYDKTYKGLNEKNREDLDEIIQAQRTIAIAENRRKRGKSQVRRMGGVTEQEAKDILKGYELKLGEKKFKDLSKRAENYYKEYKSLLKEMYDEGLVNQQFVEEFSEVDYKPTQFVKHLLDIDKNLIIDEIDAFENIPLSKKQIQSFGENAGSTSSELLDQWFILQKSILTRTKSIFANRLNRVFFEEFTKNKKEIDALKKKDEKELTKAEKKRIKDFKNVDDEVMIDKIVGFTDSGNPKYLLDDANTKGYNPLYYYENGVKNRMYMKKDFFEKFTDTNNRLLSHQVQKDISMVTGTALLKTLATGNNPLFFITNTPRDFMFALTYSKEYGNELISNAVKLGVGMVKGVRSVLKGDEDFKKYLEYGGGMDFLSIQGKFKSNGWMKDVADAMYDKVGRNKVFGTLSNVKKALDKFNLASEMGIRVAIFNKSIKNQLKELGVKDIETLPKNQQEDIYTSAIRSAREISDFNQGGKVIKAADAAVPYINAATQGTRAMVSNLMKRPVETMVRLTQVAGYTAASMISGAFAVISMMRDDDEETKGMTNAEIYFETLRGVSQYDLQNNYIIPTGKKDEKGEWIFYKIAKSQQLTPVINATEYFVRQSMAKANNVNYDEDFNSIMWSTVKDNVIPIKLNPIDIASSIPLVNATLGWYGIDGYTGNPLSWKMGKIPKQLEGTTSKYVEPLYKEIGDTFEVSPVRLQKVVESYITNPGTNAYVGIGYGLGNAVFSDEPIGETGENLLGDLSKAFTKRFKKSTSEYNYISKIRKKVEPEVLKIYKEDMLLEDKARTLIRDFKLLDKKDQDRDKLRDDIDKVFKDYPERIEDIAKWIASEIKKEKLNPLVSSLRFQSNDKVRSLYLVERFGDMLKNPNELQGQEKEIYQSLVKNKVYNEDVKKEYLKLLK